jgi:hypothetical protein
MTRFARWLVVAAFLLAGAIPAQAGTCDFAQLEVVMDWAYNHRSVARKSFQEGVLIGGVAGAKQIEAGYRSSQPQDLAALKLLNDCGPIDLLRIARKLAASEQ